MTDHHDRTPPVASSQQDRTDAPDRVWVCTGHNGLVSHSYVTFKPEVAANNIVRGYTVTEMIRADTAEARIRELEEVARKDEAFAGIDGLFQASQEKLRRAEAEVARLREALVHAAIPLEVVCSVYPDRAPEGITTKTWMLMFEGRDAIRDALRSPTSPTSTEDTTDE